eukprot:maker-scaffold369_size193746-snap-gene-0.35 protein:Tk07565 transcript:maker-scaffold369_size193746-snap-gene-0.35-mRNA-1 annotation:"methionyl-trna mitochondrial-like"
MKPTMILSHCPFRTLRPWSSSALSASPLKVLFFGTDQFSFQTLQALRRQQLDPQSRIDGLEVCSPRMRDLVPKVREFSLHEGLPLHDQWPPRTEDLRDFDVGVVASFGKLIPKHIIETFPRGVLNVHASLLPRWRGASPIAHAIWHGDSETGISIMEVEPHHFDIGHVLAVDKCSILPDETRQELTQKLGPIGAELMVKVLEDLESYQARKQPQSEAGITY